MYSKFQKNVLHVLPGVYRGRVSVCGAISHYNEQGGYSKVMDILPLCVFKVTIMTLSTRPVGHQCPTLGQGRFLTLLG